MRKQNGWGLGMMLALLGVLFIFALIALYYLNLMYRSGVLT